MMKSVKNQNIRFCGAAVLLLAAFMMAAGCSSPGSGHGAYPTLKQTKMNVDGPMVRYHNADARGGLTLGERERVDDAYKNFKKAFDEAVQDAHGDLEVTTPDNVKVLANHVIEVISAIPF